MPGFGYDFPALAVRRSGGGASAPALLTAIGTEGWNGTVNGTPPTEYDPVGDAQTFTVLSPGFSGVATPVTRSRNVTIMKRVRQPHPNETTKTADTAALNRVIHAGDTIVGMTNNSTRAVTPPGPMWIDADYRMARTNSITVRLFVAHRYGQDGAPLAGVRFILSDGTNSVTADVSSLTTVSYTASGHSGSLYEATLDITALNNGICTKDVIMYPFVGAATQASVDYSGIHSINFGVHRFIKSVSGSYGEMFAYVNASTGNDGTGVASATAATAAASPYLTLAAAVTAVKTAVNSAHGRNEAGGGTIRLVDGTHTFAPIRTAAGTTTAPLVIESVSGDKTACTLVDDGGSSSSSSLPIHTEIRNIRIRKVAAGSSIKYDNAATLSAMATSGHMIALDGCDLDLNGRTDYSAYFYRTGRLYLINCTGTMFATQTAFGTDCKEIALIGTSLTGNTGTGNAGAVYHVFASKTHRLRNTAGSTNREVCLGQVCAFSFVGNLSSTNGTYECNKVIDARGVYHVMSVFEQANNSNTSACYLVNGDGDLNTCADFWGFGVTIVGARMNFLYNDEGILAILKSGAIMASVINSGNTKSDLFIAPISGQNGNRVGNWQVIYRVDFDYTTILAGSANSDVTGVGNWLGEVDWIGAQIGPAAAPLDADWTLDASANGTQAGNGDYRPLPGSVIAKFPGAFRQYPIDFLGQTVPSDGTAFRGALQAA